VEELLRSGLLVVICVFIAVAAGPRLLRLVGGAVLGLAFIGVLIKAPADATIGGLISGGVLFGLGTWWRHRRREADEDIAWDDHPDPYGEPVDDEVPVDASGNSRP
jgi:hypothetical protein